MFGKIKEFFRQHWFGIAVLFAFVVFLVVGIRAFRSNVDRVIKNNKTIITISKLK